MWAADSLNGAAGALRQVTAIVLALMICTVSGPLRTKAQATRLSSAAGKGFGSTVSAVGDRVAVGSPDEADNAGAVYVYRIVPGQGWSLEARLAGIGKERFGQSVAMDGAQLLVGAPDGGPMGGGSAYLLRSDSLGWHRVEHLVPPQPGQGDKMGAAVALRGLVAMVGAPLRAAGSGAVYVFEQTGPVQWGLRQVLTTSASGAAHLGGALDLEQDIALVGAPLSDEQRGQEAGMAFVFERTGSSDWAERATLVAGDATGGSAFGASVSVDVHALSGRATVFVGAPFAGAATAGAAYLFSQVGGQWTQRARYESAGRMAQDRIGSSLAVAEDHFLIGMPGVDADAGAVTVLTIDTTVFAWHERAWHASPQQPMTTAFGHALAISSSFMVVGAPLESKTDSTSGAAYIFERSVALGPVPGPPHSADEWASYPNPFSNRVTIRLPSACVPPLNLTIINIVGRQVAMLPGPNAWQRTVTWQPPNHLAHGVYVVTGTYGYMPCGTHLMVRSR